MGIARSIYYDQREKPVDDTAIVGAMFAICDEFEFYGYRRISAALRQQGLKRDKRGWRISKRGINRSSSPLASRFNRTIRSGSLANSGKTFVERVCLVVTDIRGSALSNCHFK
jgi:hypothetical protein